MSLEEIREVEKNISDAIEELWEMQSALSGLRRYLEYTLGVKNSAFEKRK